MVPPKRKRPDDDEEQSSSLLPILGGALAVVVVSAGCIWFFFFRSAGGAEVAGKVLLDNEPVAFANVVFVSEDEKTQTTIEVPSDDKGAYRLIGNSGPRIPPGKYKVAVTKIALQDGKLPKGSDELLKARAANLLVNVLPKIYEDRATTPLSFEVKSGSNTINLELKKQ